MNLARPDQQRTRYRRPLGVAVMAYRAALGLSEILVGVLLATPSFDPQATFWPWRTGPSWPPWSCSSGVGCPDDHSRPAALRRRFAPFGC
jgi:hypothetical protein